MTETHIAIITLVFTAVVAICTGIYSFLTFRLVRETRLSREFHLEANIISYLVCSESSPHIVSLVIKNIGNGIARKVKFKINKDINYPDTQNLSRIGVFNKQFDFFPPGYEFKFYLTSLLSQTNEKENDFLDFDIEYSDNIKKNRQQKFILEFKDVKGFGKFTPPETYIGMISYRLEKIENLLEKQLKG